MALRSPALAALASLALGGACSTSSSQSGGGWPDAGFQPGDDATFEAGDDVGAADAPEGDGQACACGQAFKSCPPTRPCVIATATAQACTGYVCCAACDGGTDSGAAGDGGDAGRTDAGDAGRAGDAAHDAKKD